MPSTVCPAVRGPDASNGWLQSGQPLLQGRDSRGGAIITLPGLIILLYEKARRLKPCPGYQVSPQRACVEHTC